MTSRRKISRDTLEKVLVRSRRRCAICFVDGVREPQPGNVARLDHASNVDTLENLVFLCARHHAEFRAGLLKDAQARAARNTLYHSVDDLESQTSPAGKGGQEYEEQAVNFIRAQFMERLGDFFSLQRNALCPGRSGVSYQVDIVVRFQVAGLRYFTIVEIKSRRLPLGTQEVLELAAKSVDIGADKAVMVSSEGFTPAAIMLARTSGIGLIGKDAVLGEFRAIE